VKFNSNTISILENFSDINPSLLFRPGTTLATISPVKTIVAKAQLDEEIPQEFAIYDLKGFLKMFSFFDGSRIVNIEEKWLTITSDKQYFRNGFAAKDIIIAPPNKDIKLASPEVSFALSNDTLKRAMKVLATFRGPIKAEDSPFNLGIVGDGSKVELVVNNWKNRSSNIFRLELEPTDKKFQVVFKETNLKLMNDSYKVEIYKKGMGHFKGSVIEYFIAFEADNSWFEEVARAATEEELFEESPLEAAGAN
jgi:gp45 sliding clamp, C terminal